MIGFRTLVAVSIVGVACAKLPNILIVYAR